MRLILSLLISLSVLVTGSAFGASQSKDPLPHLNRANAAEPESLDPQLIHTLPGMLIAGDLFDGLVHRDNKGDIVPAQAKSWAQSADGLTWTFHLRQSQWSDGRPVVAADFVRAWRRAVTPGTGAAYAWYIEMMAIKNAHAIIQGDMKPDTLGVSAPDQHTLTVQLEKPVPWLVQMLVTPVLYPQPESVVEKYGHNWTSPQHIVTNGPYQLKDWIVNEKIDLVANPKYPEYDSLSVKSVSYYPLPSATSAFNRYRAGDLDMTRNIPDGYYKKLTSSRPDELHVTHMLGTEYYAFNTRRAPFNNPRVRRALSLALDRDLITEKVLGEGQVSAYNFVPPYMNGMPAYTPEAQVKARNARLAEARALYREAGFSKAHPLKLTLLYNTSESRQKIAIAAAHMWKANLGVEVTLENMEWKSVISRIRQQDFDVARASWVADFNDPASMYTIFGSTNSSNKPKYQSPIYDALLKKMNTPNADRQQLFIEMEKVLAKDSPIVPLYYYVSPSLVSPKVKGWYDNPRDLTMTRYLSVE
ncbi:peptide ABC transporter substrate-binding protein [Sansalvadorimonas verongulae]|uniref:peptide ABC transporter substrate-binding protein n=1 Tax=Sansalvadorimonas verongulae TaxID=2172824 RepID=UPI0012BB9667|nr:peptide ABC transporter substrate-binding protein [Sansalvadorimonas verongulae]MTI12885.1 peptide ABC transporter substrate-binding protein [Sansalvadorimonas verongulae]